VLHTSICIRRECETDSKHRRLETLYLFSDNENHSRYLSDPARIPLRSERGRNQATLKPPYYANVNISLQADEQGVTHPPWLGAALQGRVLSSPCGLL